MSDTFNDAAAAADAARQAARVTALRSFVASKAATAAEIVASKAALAASDAAVTASLADWAADNLRTRQ